MPWMIAAQVRGVHVPAGDVPPAPVDYGNPLGCSVHGMDCHPGCWDCKFSQQRLDTWNMRQKI